MSVETKSRLRRKGKKRRRRKKREKYANKKEVEGRKVERVYMN